MGLLRKVNGKFQVDNKLIHLSQNMFWVLEYLWYNQDRDTDSEGLVRALYGHRHVHNWPECPEKNVDVTVYKIKKLLQDYDVTSHYIPRKRCYRHCVQLVRVPTYTPEEAPSHLHSLNARVMLTA